MNFVENIISSISTVWLIQLEYFTELIQSIESSSCAKSETVKQMRQALRFSLDPNPIWPQLPKNPQRISVSQASPKKNRMAPSAEMR